MVAFAGATGSGKSSLMNAVTGTDAATVGARRPTTADPVAVLRSDPQGAELLDWLEIDSRYLTEAVPDGLIIVDLPDVDSVQAVNRQTAARLIGAVDVLVWVLDPQKYADAVVHTEFLAPMAAYAAVTVVVLNQIDLLADDERQQVLADVSRRLADDGIGEVRVHPASALTGDGVGGIREVLTRFAASRTAADARLSADIDDAAAALARTYPPGKAGAVGAQAKRGLYRELAAAAGVPQVSRAIAGSFRFRSRKRTGWPVTRWIGSFRADPLRRLNLQRATRPELEAGDSASTAVSALPPGSAIQTAKVDTALAELGRTTAAGVAEPWHSYVRQAPQRHGARLADELDTAVAGAVPAQRDPRWWRIVGGAQWLAVAVLVAGALWLGVLAVLSYLQFPAGRTPQLGPLPLGDAGAQLPALPWPTVLVLAGVIIGLGIALLCRIVTGFGARRRARRATATLTGVVAQRADELVLEPLTQARAAVDRYREAIRAAR